MGTRNKGLRLIKILLLGVIIVIVYNVLMVNIFKIINRNGRSLFNYNMYIITTDSMKPSINSGDIIITKRGKEQNLNIGDIIAFNKQGDVITHRIIDIKENQDNKKTYITKGDNNNTQDKQGVLYNEIVGKQILKIPLIGKVALLMQNNVYILILIIVILIIYSYIQRIEERNTKRREKKKKEDEKFQDKT